MSSGARKAIAAVTKKVTKKVGSKKKDKDVGTSKRRCGDDTPEEEEEPDNPNDSDYMPKNESASFMVDEEEVTNQGGGNIDAIIDVLNYTIPMRQWTQKEFAIARNANAYNEPHDTYNLYFRTNVQEQAYFSSLMDCTVFAHQRVDFGYLESKGVLERVAIKLQNLGIRPFLEYRCDWNDTIIRQFYATYEMDFDGETIKWMTGKGEVESTFAEFAAANHLDYAYFSDGVNVYNEDIHENTVVFYEPGTPATITNCLSTGLRHHPAVINNIIRHTFMPKSGNKDKVRQHYWNVINHIMSETRINVVLLILEQMIVKKRLVRDSIYFAPYIMATIKVETGFNGPCDVKHEVYRPFCNFKVFLNRPLTPYGQNVEAQDVEEHASEDEHDNVDDTRHVNVDNEAYGIPPPPPPPIHPMQPKWEPPAGYFDAYFLNIQQSMNTQFQQMQSGFNSHSEAYGQQMNDTFQTMQHGFQ
jgi:hypothetical protein